MPDNLIQYLRKNYGAVVFAAIGGVLPHIVALNEYLLHPDGLINTTSKSGWMQLCVYGFLYTLGLLVVAALGAVLCAALKETQHLKALVVGIAAPALVVIMQIDSQKKAIAHQIELIEQQKKLEEAKGHRIEQKIKKEVPDALDDPFPKEADTNEKMPTPPTASRRPSGISLSLVTSAYAQASPPPDQNAQGTIVEVYASRKSEAFVAEFLGDKYQILKFETFGPGDSKVLVSPPGANSIQFTRGDFHSSPVDLKVSPGFVLACEVRVVKEGQINFATAFGKDPTTFEFKVDAKRFPLTPVGTRGWVYAGKWKGNSWDSVYWTFPDVSLPVVGQKASVKFPLKIRPDGPAKGNSVATLRVGQVGEVVSEPKDTGDGHIWVEVVVVDATSLQ